MAAGRVDNSREGAAGADHTVDGSGSGSAGLVAERPKTARRGSLDRITVLREAVRFIDERGRNQLTMRRLGAELGVEAMALYRYVPGREHLLDGVVEYVMNELWEATPERTIETWQEYLQVMAHAVRGVANKHPRVFPLVATRPPAAPWLRPPLRSLRWVEAFLKGLADFGFGHDESVRVYRAFSSFLLGHLLVESGSLDEGTEGLSAEEDIEFFESNDLSNYPTLTSMEGQLSDDTFDEEFEDALEALITRLSVGR